MSNESLQKRLDDSEKRASKYVLEMMDMRTKHSQEVYELEQQIRKLEKQLEDFDAPHKRIAVANEVIALFNNAQGKGEEQVQADVKNYIDHGVLPNTSTP